MQFTAARRTRRPIARLARGLFVSVMPEPAPIQITRNAQPITVYQGSQILVPFHLVRRTGFDEKVTAAVQNLPPNANIERRRSLSRRGGRAAGPVLREGQCRGGAAGGVVHAIDAGLLSPEPARADRLKAAFDAATAAAKMAQDAATAATQAKTAAVTAATQAAECSRRLRPRRRRRMRPGPRPSRRSSRPRRDSGTSRSRPRAQVQAVATAEAAAVEAKKAVRRRSRQRRPGRRLSRPPAPLSRRRRRPPPRLRPRNRRPPRPWRRPRTALKALNEKIQQADAAVTKTTAENTAAAQAKTQAEQAEQAAVTQAKQAEEARKGAEKASGDQEKASAAKNVNFLAVTEPILIEVKPAPVKLTLNVPNGGSAEAGEKIEIKATVRAAERLCGAGEADVAAPARRGGGVGGGG